MKKVKARTDLISLKELHEDSVLIKYSNTNDFAGIAYSSLNYTYYLRIIARFFRERQPEENESDSLTDGEVVKLSSSTKCQKLLEIDPLPYHVHKSTRLALQHNTVEITKMVDEVEIDEGQWEKEEAYETQPLDMFYPLETGTCWLTQKFDSVFNNVFG